MTQSFIHSVVHIAGLTPQMKAHHHKTCDWSVLKGLNTQKNLWAFVRFMPPKRYQNFSSCMTKT